MRTAAKVDRNQIEIIAALRDIPGCTVQPLHAVGSGVPDLIVGYKGRNIFMEIKDGAKPPSRRKLTPKQIDWHNSWTGQACIVENIEQAIAAVMKQHDKTNTT